MGHRRAGVLRCNIAAPPSASARAGQAQGFTKRWAVGVAV